jgi:hypothetical protein
MKSIQVTVWKWRSVENASFQRNWLLRRAYHLATSFAGTHLDFFGGTSKMQFTYQYWLPFCPNFLGGYEIELVQLALTCLTMCGPNLKNIWCLPGNSRIPQWVSVLCNLHNLVINPLMYVSFSFPCLHLTVSATVHISYINSVYFCPLYRV